MYDKLMYLSEQANGSGGDIGRRCWRRASGGGGGSLCVCLCVSPAKDLNDRFV